MRVAIDATELSGHPTGVGRYLTVLLFGFLRLPGDEIFRLYLREDAAPDLPDDPRLEIRRLPHGAVPLATYWQQRVLARALTEDRPDVLFAPGDAMSLGFRGPSLLTVHDLAYFAAPEWFGRREGARRRWLTRRSALSATAIATPSAFSRDEIVRRLGVPGERIHVIPHGRDPRLDAVVPTPEDALRKRVGHAGPFALMVGSVFERRHPSLVLHAFGLLGDTDISLVIAGADRRRDGGDLRADINARGLAGRVTWLDYCSEEDLVGLYRSAHHLIYLSDYEGFGLPPLEGMGFGLPAIVTAGGALAEVYAGAAEVLPAADPTALAAAIRLLVRDAEHREGRIAAGRTLVDAHRAETCAERTLSLLRSLAGGR